MRSPILIASSMSWVTKRIVLRSSACKRRNSFCRRSLLIGSTAPNGSPPTHTPRIAPQRPRAPDPLLLAAGELDRVAVAEVGVEPDQLEQLGRPRAGAVAVP